jgi:hypothetical protein
MSSTVENLLLDLLGWVDSKERSYEEALAAWRTSCPKLPVWEEAIDRGFLERDFVSDRWVARVTPKGRAWLQSHNRTT